MPQFLFTVYILRVFFTKDQRQRWGSSLRLVAISRVVIAAALPVLLGQAVAALPEATDLPAQTALPDPLVMLDGRKVTTREMWFN